MSQKNKRVLVVWSVLLIIVIVIVAGRWAIMQYDARNIDKNAVCTPADTGPLCGGSYDTDKSP